MLGSSGRRRAVRAPSPGSSRAPVVLVHEDEEAALRRVDERAQALVCGRVAVPDLLEHDAANDDVINRGMLQQVHLCDVRCHVSKRMPGKRQLAC